jgi:hypothetical protein
MIWTSGEKISKVVQGRYDIVGWDPRGINMSEPKVSCWETEEERAVYARAVQRLPSDGPMNLAEVDAWYEFVPDCARPRGFMAWADWGGLGSWAGGARRSRRRRSSMYRPRMLPATWT